MKNTKTFLDYSKKIKYTSKSVFLFVLFVLFVFSGCKRKDYIDASNVILLFNSSSSEKTVAIEKVIPYLNHFGVNFTTVDLAEEEFPSGSPALIIIGHKGILTNLSDGLSDSLVNYLDLCQSEGTGIMSFDPLMPATLLSPSDNNEKDNDVGELMFPSVDHYITNYRKSGENQELFGYMSLPKMSVKDGMAIITGNNLPLLVVKNSGDSKIAQWTSQDWMYYSILGPLGGLDDCLWKSIVWTARKPFVMQALPPIATMRVDDAVGSGRQMWDVSPFHWVKSANKYGLKPWLGLFIYNISPEGIDELKDLFSKGLATGSPHALGRPPRPESSQENFEAYYKPQMVDNHLVPDYWYPEAIPYLSEYYDEFIYFDHNNQKPWSDEQTEKILKAVDDWYAVNGPLPMSYLIAHWGEISSNMVEHIHDNWNIEFIGFSRLDTSWGQRSRLYSGGYEKESVREIKRTFKKAPFSLYDEPVVGKPKEGMTSSRATYTSDFIEHEGKKFFYFSSAINDLTGYDWQPDNNVEATAMRGINTLARGLSGKSLAVLFTHETDYIFRVEPDNWDKIFKTINEGISMYNPVYLNTLDALKIVRAFHTSKINDCTYDIESGELIIYMSGETDVPTSVFVYTDDGEKVIERLVEIPVFETENAEAINLLNY